MAATFERIFAQAPGRVVIALFASNLNRVQHVLELAARSGRKVALNGRSMLRNLDLATGVGRVRPPPGTIVSLDELVHLPLKQAVILSTGSQAEPRAGLSQMCSDEATGAMRVIPGDWVILSGRTIPGNERSISALIGRLLERGARVLYPTIEPGIHVSGHATRPEQRRMIEAVRPQSFIPVHGEMKHLYQHLEVARLTGLTGNQLLLARDGDVIELGAGGPSVVAQIPTGRIYRDRFSPGEVTSETLRERQQVAHAGLVVVVVLVERSTNRLLAEPILHGRGLTEEETALLRPAAARAKEALNEISPQIRGDEAFVREELTRAVRSVFKENGGKRPPVMPVVMKL